MACGRKKSMPAHRFLFFRRPPYAPVSLPGLQFLLQNRSIGLFPFSRLSLVRFYSSLCPLFLHRADSECFFHRKHSELPCYAPLTSESGQIHFLNFICRKLYIVSMRTDLLRCILTFFSFIAQTCPFACSKIDDRIIMAVTVNCCTSSIVACIS